jgi:DNA repair photolyase
LEILARYNWPIIIQTKSSLVLRDLDVLKKFSDIEVGFTIISLDENKTRKLEKFASPPKERVKALKILKENGIKTFVFIGPIVPFARIEEIEKIIKETKEFAEEFYFDRLNLKPGLIEKIRKIEGFEEIEEDKMKEHYNDIKREILRLIEKEKIKAKILF